MTLLQPAEHRWVCTWCDWTDVTYQTQPHTRFHTCKGQKGLYAPMVPDGTRAKVQTHERDDYEGDDHGYTRLDGEGRPIMNTTITRDDGEDCVVYAPTAHTDLREFR